jgi:hypothetical protein
VLTKQDILAMLRDLQWSPYPRPGLLEQVMEWVAMAREPRTPVVD